MAKSALIPPSGDSSECPERERARGRRTTAREILQVRVANQQSVSWRERHRGLLTIAAAATASSSPSSSSAAAAALHRSPGDAPLLDAVRDRNAATGMFVNETARGWLSGKGIMVQPCRS